MKIICFFISGIIFLGNLEAQQTGTVKYDHLGLEFEIPQGWVGQESEAGFLMGSNDIPGIMLVMTNDAKTLSELENNAKMGIADENGTQLSLEGNLQNIGNNGLGGTFAGVLEWQPAKAFIIGMVNSKGYGLTIMAATSKDAYSSIHEELCKKVASSTRFFDAIVPDHTKEWGETLKNARLTYMASNYSNDGAYYQDGVNTGYTTGGGYSTKTVIDLCAAGYFNHSHSSSMSFDTGGGFGSGSNQGGGAGRWTVVTNPAGESVLQLNFYNGEVWEYTLTYQDNKTFLNGERYFRTYGEYTDDGPDCK